MNPAHEPVNEPDRLSRPILAWLPAHRSYARPGAGVLGAAALCAAAVGGLLIGLFFAGRESD